MFGLSDPFSYLMKVILIVRSILQKQEDLYYYFLRKKKKIKIVICQLCVFYDFF